MTRAERWRKKQPAPSPREIGKAISCAVRCRKKFGRKRFRRQQAFTDKVTSKILARFELEGTITESYWKLKLQCVLKGRELSVV